MQLLLLALVASILVYDALPPAALSAEHLGWAMLLGVAVLPKLAAIGLYALACHLGRKRLTTHAGVTLRRLDRFGALYRVSVLVLLLTDLYVGMLAAVRGAMGNLVLVDELIVLAGPMAMLVAGWAAYYPIDRRLREASLLRQIDTGERIAPVWTRRQYVVMHLRHEVALVMLPLLVILAWYETVPILLRLAAGPDAATDATLQFTLRAAGALTVFGLAPLILRYIWDTRTMPAGDLRDMLLNLCEQHGVTVRDVLLWRTGGGVVNAAVMGVFGPVRYILLTDALLEQMPRRHVEAVMAHELAHVKRHHMFWLAATAIATVGLVEAVITWGLTAALGDATAEPIAGVVAGPDVLIVLSAIGAAAAWVVVFGWVSRRAERQADTFAVQHLAGGGAIEAEHAQTMIAALGDVAALNHIPVKRHSWRHGSIAWRQAYLRSLIGQHPDRLDVDRLMGRIKLATAAAVAVTVSLHWWGF